MSSLIAFFIICLERKQIILFPQVSDNGFVSYICVILWEKVQHGLNMCVNKLLKNIQSRRKEGGDTKQKMAWYQEKESSFSVLSLCGYVCALELKKNKIKGFPRLHVAITRVVISFDSGYGEKKGEETPSMSSWVTAALCRKMKADTMWELAWLKKKKSVISHMAWRLDSCRPCTEPLREKYVKRWSERSKYD